MEEEIKEIEDFPNYWITSFGRVISGPKKTRSGYRGLKFTLTKQGYLHARFCKEGRTFNRFVHDLVAKAFIPNPEGKPTVNHKNGKEKTNNRVDNLEWATRSEQTEHALSTGLYNLSCDWGISEHTDKVRNPNKPFQLRISIEGKRRSFGVYPSKEEARKARDIICNEYGITRPVRGL